MRLSIVLRLSRASNLPTVWTNVLAGMALAGGDWNAASLPLVLLSLSLFYVGGMFLNDAFDREFDARFRPERPIPSGEVSAAQVFTMGFGLLGLGLAVLAGMSMLLQEASWGAPLGGLLLGLSIVLYDAHHKANVLSPLIMGVCRMLVYVTAALAVVAQPGMQVYAGALVLLCYLIGLTYAAKSEHLNRVDHAWPLVLLGVPILYGALHAINQPLVLLPVALLSGVIVVAVRKLLRRATGDVPSAVTLLLAGICILDAIVLAGQAYTMMMAFALLAFALTLRLQHWIAGT